ncbi:hypothetical protein BDR05DRAFT_951027 [Suillus weaverae]|nr:hypothetical protein BDR05DRAFT_951027 [Suillus weaverae]
MMWGDFQTKADHIIMCLICVCGFVPTIIDSDKWKELMVHLNPHYHATSCNTFTGNYVPKEAIFVCQQQLKELKKQTNLTLTFDGTSTRKPQSLYTVHTTTPDQTTHFLDGHEDSTASHTAAWTIYEVGEDKWAAICSDSTANITLLPEFEQMLLLLKPIIKHFSKSMILAAHLQKECWVDDNDETVKALQKIGKTRHPMQMLQMSSFFWLAIAVTLEELFAKGEEQTGIPVSLVQCITAIFNSRWKEFFSYPLSNNIMKLALAAPTIHIPAQISNASANAEHPMPHPCAYHHVKEFLKPMLHAMVEPNEVHELKDPISLLVHEIGAAGVVDEFGHQFEAYFHNEWPFNTPLQDGNPLTWWNMLLPHPHACVLAALAVKIFLVLINSMPDKRTGSKLTWLNSAIQGNQNAQTLVDMIQIGQWYGTKAENSKPCKEPYRPTVKFCNINRDHLHAVATEVKPATDNVTFDVDTGHDSEDSEDSPDDVKNDLVDCCKDDEMPEDDFLQVDEDIHLGSPLLCDLISMVPVIGSQNV